MTPLRIAQCVALASLLLAGCVSAPGAEPTADAAGFANRVRAPELPAETPVLTGAILSHTASTITVRGASDGARTDADPPAPVIVKISAQTAIYVDTTAAGGVQPTRQTVTRVDSLDAVELQSTIGRGGGVEGYAQVWGVAADGQIAATVVVVLRASGRPRVLSTIATDSGGNSGGY